MSRAFLLLFLCGSSDPQSGVRARGPRGEAPVGFVCRSGTGLSVALRGACRTRGNHWPVLWPAVRATPVLARNHLVSVDLRKAGRASCCCACSMITGASGGWRACWAGRPYSLLCQVGSNDVSGAAIQAVARMVVPAGRAGIFVARVVLHVTQAGSGVQGEGDGRMAQQARPAPPLRSGSLLRRPDPGDRRILRRKLPWCRTIN